MDIFELSPREFRSFLEEERQYRTPEQIDDLMRRYNQANSLSGRLSGLLAPQEGRRRTTFFPASVPEGMSLFDAFRAGEAELAVPQGIVDMVTGTVRGVENPGLAAQGRIPAADMNAAGFETAAAAMGLSGLFAGRGGFTPDPTTTRIFAGPKAKTADLDALKVAKELSARRRDPDEIFRETGWFKGADNQWRFEIPDDKVEFIADPTRLPEYQLKRAAGLGDVIKHDELFAAYPELRGLLTQTGDNPTPYGGWQPYQDRSSEGFVDIEEEMRAYGPTRRDVESVLLHEIDHAVANREGFSGGTNQSEATNRILEQQNIDLYNLEQRMEKRTEELGLSPFDYRPDTTDPELLQLRSEYDAKLGRSPSNQDIFAMYQRNMGEVAARNTESRRDMTAAERRETPPRLTEDTPREAQWTEGVISAASSEPAGSLGANTLRVYHGTDADISQLDPNYGVTARDLYTTPVRSDAAEYGKNVLEFDVEGKIGNFLPEDRGISETRMLQAAYSDYGLDDYFDSFDDFVEAFDSGDMYQRFGSSAAQDEVVGALIDVGGFDAIRIPDAGFGGNMSESVVAQNPNVFKPVMANASKGTFDADGNVVSANASPISGLLAQSGVSSEQAQRIEDYLYRTGLLQ